MGTEVKNKTLGEYVLIRRQSRGLTRYQAAEASGLDYSYWGKLEAGQYASPHPKALEAVAAALDAPLVELYALAGYETPTGLPGLGPYLRRKYHLPPDAIDQLESYFAFLRHQYGIEKGTPVFPPKPNHNQPQPDRRAGRSAEAA